MREIKFRAWDKKRGIFHWGISNICLTLGGNLMWQFGYNAPNFLDKEEAKDYILQQYTGLKDKNGKEIYEGDIVRKHWSSYWDGKPKHFTQDMGVAFEEGAFIAQDVNNPKIKHTLYGSEKYWQGNPWEVIGNIYENKELL